MTFNILSTEKLRFQEGERTYHVADRDLKGAPRFFITYNCGIPIISNEVPELYRPPMVIHELVEFEQLQGHPHCCVTALHEELRHVPPEGLSAYLPFRRDVFRELVSYLGERDPRSLLLPRVRESLDELERLVGPHGR